MAGSLHTTPCQSPVPQEIISVEQAQQNAREIPSESWAGRLLKKEILTKLLIADW
jgi:hypothetical protein